MRSLSVLAWAAGGAAWVLIGQPGCAPGTSIRDGTIAVDTRGLRVDGSIPGASIYAPGPREAVYSVEGDAASYAPATDRELRVVSGLGLDGRWTVSIHDRSRARARPKDIDEAHWIEHGGSFWIWRQTLAFRRTDEGTVVLERIDDRTQTSRTHFEPALVMAPARVEAGVVHRHDTGVRVERLGDSKELDRGTARQELALLGWRTRGAAGDGTLGDNGEAEVATVLTVELSYARVVRDVRMMVSRGAVEGATVAPPARIDAENERKLIRVKGITISDSRRRLAR